VQVKQNHTAAVEYAQNEQVRHTAGLQSGFDLPERAYTGELREQTASFWVTSAFPTVLNELRARVSRNRLEDRAVTATPAVVVLEAFNAGGNQDALFREDATDTTRVSNVTTFARSTHSIRVGAQTDFVRVEQVDRANFNGTFTFGSDVARDQFGSPIAGVTVSTCTGWCVPAWAVTARRNSRSSPATPRSHCRSPRAPGSRRTTGGRRHG
jgi:hypothetical protein